MNSFPWCRLRGTLAISWLLYPKTWEILLSWYPAAPVLNLALQPSILPALCSPRSRALLVGTLILLRPSVPVASWGAERLGESVAAGRLGCAQVAATCFGNAPPNSAKRVSLLPLVLFVLWEMSFLPDLWSLCCASHWKIRQCWQLDPQTSLLGLWGADSLISHLW